MKTLLLTLFLFLIAAEAHAISTYRTTSMSCSAVQAVVREEGQVILRWMSMRVPGLPRYGRYVRSDRWCNLGEDPAMAYVPTSDKDSCLVYQCRPTIKFKNRVR